MTALLYQTDSYLQSFDAKVTAADVEAHAVVLDRTAFYPGGGGQPCDLGALTIVSVDYPVVKVQKRGADALHFLSSESPLPQVGAAAYGQIDWERHYQLMRTHTALHILCGVVFRDYGALVTGGDDVCTAILPRAQAFEIPDLIRTKINLLPQGITEVRTVEIVGLDLQADGGAHVRNTREVGGVRLVDYKSKGRINKRIYIEVGN